MQADDFLNMRGDDENITNHHVDVSRETLERFQIYRDLLNHWQEKTNLVSASTVGDFWKRHIADSMQCLQIKPNGKIWTDIGSGGGFPGLVIAIALTDISDCTITLVESNRKKCAFLRTVMRETGAKATIIAERAETFISKNNYPEIITARAVMPLQSLIPLCKHWLSGKATGLFHKGRNYRGELQESQNRWRFDLVEHQSKTSGDSVILEIANLDESAC